MILARCCVTAILVLSGTGVIAQTSDESHTIVEALRSGDYGGAHEMVESALKQWPEDPRLWTLNGLALSHLADSRGAIEAFRRALAQAPDYVPALEGEAQLLYRQHSQEAVPLLRRLQQLRPENRTSVAMLAILAFERRDCKDGLESFEASRALFFSEKAALEQAGACFVHLNRAADAIPIFHRVLELTPDDKRVRYNLGVAEWQAGRYRDVIGTLVPLSEDSVPDADVLDLLAEAYEASEDTPKAVATLRFAIAVNPAASRYYVDFADICLVHSSFQVGVDMLDFGLRHVPTPAPLYLARGILYAQLGQYEKSESDFTRADELSPNISGASEAEGMVALQQNRPGEAEMTIRQRLQKNPDDAFLNYLLAEALARAGASPGSEKFTEAIAAASRAIQVKPKFSLARDVLSRLYLQEGKTQKAIEQDRLALRDDPTDQTALYHLILALKKAGKNDELPGLLTQLAKLKQQSRIKETNERKYTLVEGASGEKRN
jgi:tetratricopeptide (TPR) repeat protein